MTSAQHYHLFYPPPPLVTFRFTQPQLDNYFHLLFGDHYTQDFTQCGRHISKSPNVSVKMHSHHIGGGGFAGAGALI